MLTYKKSGVDIKKAENFKKQIVSLVRKQGATREFKSIGSFGGFFSLGKKEYRDCVLVSSCDGVGTKLKIAALVNRHDTIGIDAVAMNVNDILCTGAEPLFFLDYIGYSKLASGILLDIVKGINRGCVQAGCCLIGGETAQMPDMYQNGEYDLAGFCVGAVKKNRIIDGSNIKPADILLGIESYGLHSNGFSLVRKVFTKNELKRYADEILKPTRIYVKPVISLLNSKNFSFSAIKGIAHITGGAFYDKIARILPANVNAQIYKSSWTVPKIFKLIQDKGNISQKEMYHTFNMGIGLVLVLKPQAVNQARKLLSKFNLNTYIIGSVVKGKKKVEII